MPAPKVVVDIPTVPAATAPTVPVPPTTPTTTAPVVPTTPAVETAPATTEPKMPVPGVLEGVVEPPATPKAPAVKPPPDPLEQLANNEVMKWMLEEQATNPVELDAAKFATFDPEAQQFIAQLLAKASAGKAEVDKVVGQVDGAAKQAAADRAAAARERADALAWVNDTGLKEHLGKQRLKTGEVADHLSAEGIEKLVADRVAAQMEEFLAKVSEGSKARETAAKELEAAAAKESKRAETLAWAQKHQADLENPEIFAAVKDLTKTSVSPQRALELVTAERTLRFLETGKSAELEEARARLSRARAADPKIPEMPASYIGETAKELDFYKRYPEAAKRDAARLRAQG